MSSRPRSGPAATVIVAVTLAVTVVSVVVRLNAPPVAATDVSTTVSDVFWILGWAAFAVVGGLIVRRHPGHLVGWLFIGIGVLGAVAYLASAYAMLGTARPLVGADAAAWVGIVTWAPPLGLCIMAIALFPTGKPLGRWWGRIAATGTSVSFVIALSNAFAVWPLRSADLALPGADEQIHAWSIPIINVLWPLAMLTAVVSMFSLFVRFRRSTGIERQQLKWLALYVAIAMPAIVLSETVFREGIAQVVVNTIDAPAWLGVIAGLAILRYRLYDIDRIISRTLAYAVVVAVLVGVYAAGVLGLGAVARAVTGESGDLVVAVSTLLVAAAFRPVASRVRAVVDRRFNRASVDAAHAAEAFRARLRDEVDLDTVLGDLRATVHRTLAPNVISVVTLDAAAARAGGDR